VDDTNEQKPWPMDTATVKLAKDKRAQVAEGEQQPFHKPPTENGSIKIGMETTIFLPSLGVQEIGFTPYKLERRLKEGSKTEYEDVPVDATAELLAHYNGIYKRIQK
jgi:hypothetical protein